MLLHLLLWQLERNGIRWISRVSKDSVNECDIICEAIDGSGYYLIECTMRKRKDDQDPMFHNIRIGLKQLIKNMGIWRSAGLNLLGGILVVNYLISREFKESVKKARKELKTELDSLDIQILPQNYMHNNVLTILGKPAKVGY